MSLAAICLAGVAAPAWAPVAPGDEFVPLAGAPSGRVRVVAAFAYWCETWRPQSRIIQNSRRRLGAFPVDWLAVSIDGARSQVDPRPAWAKVILEDSTSWARRQGVDRVPTTLVVDQDNLIRWVGWGISQENDLVEAVKQAVAGPPRGGSIYLTFDDFPLGRSDALLDALKRAQAPATFFVVGEKAARQPELIHRAGKQGHALAVHGWTHSQASPGAARARDWLGRQTGRAPRWVRTPGSSLVRGFDGQVWPGRVVDPSDFLRPGEGEIRRRVLSRLAPGAVIQLHAGVEQTLAVLPDLVARARKLGYTLEPLP